MATSSTSSTSSYSYLSTSGNRFSGLASGMDIDSIVEKLMKAESAKMEKLQQQKQKYEWQRDAYRSVNTKLETFRTNTFDNFGKASDFVINKVSNTNEGKVGVTATSAASGTLNIESATLAISKPGVAQNTSVASLSNNSTLKDLGLDGAGTATLKVAQQDGSYKELIINYTETDTLDSIAQKINAQSKGATAIVGDDGTFSISAKATGNFAGGSIKVEGSMDLFTAIGFSSASTELANGVDGSYKVNGVTKSIKTNSFSISGYNVELKGNIDASNPVTISSTLDSTAVVDKVKSFIESYNALITDLKGQTSEKKAMDYQPLTDAQKAEMTTDEIAKWEAKAKQGILRNDNSINNALSQMRSALGSLQIDIGDGKKMSIFSLGIDTNKDGTLTIKNEEKLTKAIETNVNDIANFFAGTASSTTGEGIVAKLRSSAKAAIDSITLKAGKEGAVDNTFTLGKNILDLDKRIDDWKDRLKDIEDRYFKQFSAMETAIQNANTQSSLFTSA